MPYSGLCMRRPVYPLINQKSIWEILIWSIVTKSCMLWLSKNVVFLLQGFQKVDALVSGLPSFSNTWRVGTTTLGFFLFTFVLFSVLIEAIFYSTTHRETCHEPLVIETQWQYVGPENSCQACCMQIKWKVIFSWWKHVNGDQYILNYMYVLY